jgi:signal transduction histidine kinase
LAEISVNTTLEKLYLKEAPMLHVLTNLFTNAIKYNSKSKKQIVIDLTETEVAYEFTIADNADGIPETHLDKIFDLFTIVGQKDNEGNLGTGIGLATVKKIIESLGGTITVTSVPHEGSTFRFSIAKPVK